ncbi:uncharacterized protein FFB20_08315 [Fusarium fujikuroi]|uniref:F-box domain-containing protein n=2 Tax=Fusarium fujikuroi TaxID=5127 RepID=S0DHI1_GIBF5|nr:uncharacterized protein FFUJ_01936 [Fusarium fujikuroi IMI 58289]KLP19459.1 uncharacterized protein LW94_9651 [Fusarium fujikuroi]QGI58010.1 hypothetical protein CEK27_000135 [Fusarium fujikuroi]QGI75227.1 hypothetical protein CEK25_000133 [Fusarium fujikuroi]QGI88921.1 hypothetical protein CEK26_000136 [Fusarium fujikuroi]CCT61579.1 uncharacterized protein FFUJ_01936 [Fusarium fujikuroi IMI 58289]
MSSPSFSSLPKEVHLEIGNFLRPSEMAGIIVASKSMRKGYAASFFHDVSFRGTQGDLVGELAAFLVANKTQATTRDVVVPAIKYITIEIEPDVPSPVLEIGLILPRLISSCFRVMKNLQGIQLDFWWLTDFQKDELCDRCAGLPVWNSLRSINMENEADPELLAILVSKTRPESFTGLQFGGQTELQAARQCSPFLQRLVVPFKLPASTDVVGHSRFASNRTSLLTQFGRLEWLVLTPTHVKPLSIDTIREDPKVLLNVLVKELSKLPYLKRLGLTFPSLILAEHQPGVPGTGVGLPAVEHYVRQWNEQIFARIPALQQVAFIHEDIVLRAVREADATIRFSIESDLDRHAFPFGTLY